MQPFLAAEAIGAGSDRPAVTCSAATSPDAEQTASCGPLSVAQATRADVDGPPRLTLALSRQHAAGLLSSQRLRMWRSTSLRTPVQRRG